MKIQVLEFGLKHADVRYESDIVSLIDSKDGLNILIDTISESGDRCSMQVFFKSVRGYRFLDEGDLYYYFSAGVLGKPYHVFQVISGGWVSGEVLQTDMLQVSKAIEIKEWFIATNNGCVSVLSNCDPIAKLVGA